MKITSLFGMLKSDFDRQFKLITPYHSKVVYRAKSNVYLIGQIDSSTHMMLDKGKFYLLEVDYMLFNKEDADYILINSIETMSKRERKLLKTLELKQDRKK